MKRLALLPLLLVCGCIQSPRWQVTPYDSATSLQSCPGWSACTPFPTVASGGTLNDLEWPVKVLPEGATLSVPIEVAATPGTTYVGTESEYNLRVTMMLDEANDPGNDPYARWYATACPSGAYVLGQADNTPQVLSCPLVWTAWTDIDNQQSEKLFNYSLSHMASINVCFGGDLGLCHGLAAQGSATIEVGQPSF